MKESVIALEREYAKQKEFIRSLESNAHVGLAEDELANSFIPEDLPSSADKVYKAEKTTLCRILRSNCRLPMAHPCKDLKVMSRMHLIPR